MTKDQTIALERAGREIFIGWMRHASDLNLNRDYDFGAEGDWQLVRDTARAVGLTWEGAQPEDREVWMAVARGYRAAYDAHVIPRA